MKRILMSLVIAVAALAFVTSAAHAANENGPPPGLDADSVITCDGVETTVQSGQGRSGWLNGEKWAIVTIEATFEGETVFAKTYGNGPSGETMDCTGGSGPFALFVTVVKVQ